MKKTLVTLIVLAALGFSACKKDLITKPTAKVTPEKLADKKDCGTWD